MIRLNLGCGNKLLEGYINVDKPGNYSGKKPDVEADIRSLPFEDEYADEILAVHVIEHFYLWEVEDVLKEWHRVLKPLGTLILELPDFEKIIHFFGQAPRLSYKQITALWWGLYGDPRYRDPDMCHKWAYTFEDMKEILSVVGFTDIQKQEARYHVPARDMRIQARKESKVWIPSPNVLTT